MDVLLKRREDGKKGMEARAKQKEKMMEGIEERKRLQIRPNTQYHAVDESTGADYLTQLFAGIFKIRAFEIGSPELEENKVTFEINQRITPDEYYMGNTHCLWTSLPDSIVAVNLALALNAEIGRNVSDYLKASLVCGLLPLIMTFVIELVTVICIYEVNSDLEGNEAFCDQTMVLQMSVVGIFLLTLLSPLNDVYIEASIGFSSTRCVYDAHEGAHLFIYGANLQAPEGKEFEEIGDRTLIVKECKTNWLSFIVYWLSVGTEAGVLMFTLWIGIHYTLSQPNAGEIVQAAVAIAFINEIDNMVYEAAVSEPMKDFIGAIEYEVPYLSGGGKKTLRDTVIQVFCIAPVMVAFTYYIVDYLRENHCQHIFLEEKEGHHPSGGERF